MTPPADDGGVTDGPADGDDPDDGDAPDDGDEPFVLIDGEDASDAASVELVDANQLQVTVTPGTGWTPGTPQVVHVAAIPAGDDGPWASVSLLVEAE